MLYAQGIKLDSVYHDIGRALYCDSTGHFGGYTQLPDQGDFDDLVDYNYALELELSCSGTIGLFENQSIEDIKEGARILMLLQKADNSCIEVRKFTVKRENSSEEQEISLNNPVWDNT